MLANFLTFWQKRGLIEWVGLWYLSCCDQGNERRLGNSLTEYVKERLLYSIGFLNLVSIIPFNAGISAT